MLGLNNRKVYKPYPYFSGHMSFGVLCFNGLWLPPLKTYWCEYGKRWERIKDKYRLWYSSQERITLHQLAETCLE